MEVGGRENSTSVSLEPKKKIGCSEPGIHNTRNLPD